MNTLFRTPLTTEELTAIRKRHPSSMDTLALLWEIKRLRCQILRIDQLARSDMPWGPFMMSLWEELKKDLLVEPCIMEQMRLEDDVEKMARK